MSDISAVKAAVRLAINRAVANGEIAPEEALSVLMTVAATYVAQVDDPKIRRIWVETVVENFGDMVELARGGNVMTGDMQSTGATRQ